MHKSVGSLRNTVQVHSCILLRWYPNGRVLVGLASTASEIEFPKSELVSLSPGKVKNMLLYGGFNESLWCKYGKWQRASLSTYTSEAESSLTAGCYWILQTIHHP